MKAFSLLLPLLSLFLATALQAQNWSIQMTGGDPAMHIVCDGQLVTKYHYKDVPRPFFYPVIGPSGEEMTRGWPMEPHDDEATDHPHHRGLWFAHGDVNGVDFWHDPDNEKRPGGTIRHAALGSMRAGSGPLMFTSRNDWISPDGKLICQDERTHHFQKLPDGSLAIDIDVTLKATQQDIVFGDTQEGTAAIRVIPTLRLEGDHASGQMINSDGVKGKDVWGKRAAWVDYFGKDRKGNAVGIAIFNHPENLHHPTWWHARPYGLFAANPFGRQGFEGKEAESGAHRLEKGEELRLRYRFLFHTGGPEDATVDEKYRLWVSP